MIILERNKGFGSNRAFVLLFGAGLIGQSIVQAARSSGSYTQRAFPFNWDDPAERQVETATILAFLKQRLAAHAPGSATAVQIAILWSAGKVGFDATREDMQHELESFSDVLGITERLMDEDSTYKVCFHLISSAGGLFEGQRMVNHDSKPHPVRTYGELKLKEEELVRALGRGAASIYRPTSVFGFIGNRYRRGLIPTLMLNGLGNRVSTIYGDFNTLRDYLYCEDIGRFVAQRLFDSPPGSSLSAFFLCSGKPSSIYEIKHGIEQFLGRKIYLRCEMLPEMANTSDITFSSAAIPPGMISTDLRTAISLVGERIRAGLACH